jgi:hypothetical protein
MAVTLSEHNQFMRDYLAQGYVTGFYYGPLGALDLNNTFSGSGGLSGQALLIRPKSRYIAAPRVIDGLIFRPDGSVLNPWKLASSARAPVQFAQFTQTFVYHGHPAITMQYYEKLLGRVGLTGDLILSYGRVSGESFGVKYCDAMLLSVSSPVDRVLVSNVTTEKTLFEVTATWQQTGAFWY